MSKLSKRNTTLLFVFVVGVLVVTAFISYNKILQYNKSVEALTHINHVKDKIEDVLSNLKNAEIEQRNYLLTGDSAFIETFNLQAKATNHNLDELNAIIINDAQQQNIIKLKLLVGEKLALLNKNLSLRKKIPANSSSESALFKGKEKMEDVRAQVQLMLQLEDEFVLERTQIKNHTAAKTPVFLLSLSLFSILVISVFFFRLQQEITKRISISESNELLQQAKQQIETSEKILSNVLSQSLMAIAILKEPEMIVAFANETMLKLFGKGKAILNKPLQDGVPELNNQLLPQLLTNVFTTGVPYEGFEIKVNLERNGKATEAYFNFIFQPYRGIDDKITGITVYTTEVTEQVLAKKHTEESEERFRTLSESIPHMMWTATPDGRKNFFNQYFLDYTGFTAEELAGEGWQKIIYPEDLERELEHWNQTIKTGEDFKIEKRVRHHSGTYRWHLNHGIAQRDNDGNIIGWIGTNTEIDDQKKITEALAKGEEQFRTFANSIQNLAWIANGDGWVYWYNQQWYDYTGTTLEEMEGWGWVKVQHPDHLKRVEAFFKEGWKKDEPLEVIIPLRKFDGEYRWFLTRAFPLKDADGNIERWIGTNTDITEQQNFTQELELKVKERTAELEERKNFAESILETSHEYITVYAKDFSFISINNATEELIGMKREDILGKTLFEVFPSAKGTKAESDLQSAFNGNSIKNEVYHSSLTGHYIENYITPLKDSAGNVFAALTIAKDVTSLILKQKEIETVNEQLQLQNQTFDLAEKIGKFGSYNWNTTTGAMVYSDNFYLLLDCEPQEFLPSFKKFLSFIHPDDLNRVIKNGQQSIETGFVDTSSFRIITKNGTLKYFRASGKFIDGHNRMLIGTVQDITEDMIASEKVLAKNIELQNANAELASFSYVASHDLQEPLRKIQGFSKRIVKQEEQLSDAAKDYFMRINSAAQRMQNLIISILSFTSTSITAPELSKTDLNEILKEVKAELQETITLKNARIIAEQLPIICAVPIQMHQLFLNLINNSLKYSKTGVNPVIKITAMQVCSDEMKGTLIPADLFWKIEFSDNGIGFEQQYASKIFEFFQRLHSKSAYEGTGIGLAICKKIVQMHHGTISAIGKLGIGSTFTIILPDKEMV